MQTTPVSVMELQGQRWLVCPYGERQWVKNARAGGEVSLTRGRRTETVAVEEELDPDKERQCAQAVRPGGANHPPFFQRNPRLAH